MKIAIIVLLLTISSLSAQTLVKRNYWVRPVSSIESTWVATNFFLVYKQDTIRCSIWFNIGEEIPSYKVEGYKYVGWGTQVEPAEFNPNKGFILHLIEFHKFK